MQSPGHSRWPQLGALDELLLLLWRPATEGKIHGGWPTGRGSARGCCSSHHPPLNDRNCCSRRLTGPCPACSPAPAPAGDLCFHAYSHSCGTPCRAYTVGGLCRPNGSNKAGVGDGYVHCISQPRPCSCIAGRMRFGAVMSSACRGPTCTCLLKSSQARQEVMKFVEEGLAATHQPWTRVLTARVQQPRHKPFKLHIRGSPAQYPPRKRQQGHASAAAALVRGTHSLNEVMRAATWSLLHQSTPGLGVNWTVPHLQQPWHAAQALQGQLPGMGGSEPSGGA